MATLEQLEQVVLDMRNEMNAMQTSIILTQGLIKRQGESGQTEEGQHRTKTEKS